MLGLVWRILGPNGQTNDLSFSGGASVDDNETKSIFTASLINVTNGKVSILEINATDNELEEINITCTDHTGINSSPTYTLIVKITGQVDTCR